jgi:exodeoxyribonuclease III
VRIISFNANGLRSAASKGFFEWFQRQRADVLCVQETRAQSHQLEAPVFRPDGYEVHLHDAERKGYSGVALYSRNPPDRVSHGLGWSDFDREGRWIQADYGSLSVVSLYFPSGSSGDARQEVKFELMERFRPLLEKLRRSKRQYVICGDWNIAHREIDLKNWRGNQKNSGFLPEERAWMDWLFGDAGYVDVFRRLDPRPEQYTWWSNRGQAWAKNVGWRIDYHVATPGIADTARSTAIYRDQRFSDHAPLIVDYEHTL